MISIFREDTTSFHHPREEFSSPTTLSKGPLVAENMNSLYKFNIDTLTSRLIWLTCQGLLLPSPIRLTRTSLPTGCSLLCKAAHQLLPQQLYYASAWRMVQFGGFTVLYLCLHFLLNSHVFKLPYKYSWLCLQISDFFLP